MIDIVEKVSEIVKENLELEIDSEFELDMDLESLGMTSLSFIGMVVAIEEVFGCEIPDSKLLLTEMNTVNKICQLVSELLSEEVDDSELEKNHESSQRSGLAVE